MESDAHLSNMADIVQAICWSILAALLLPINIICLFVIWQTRQVNKVTKIFLLSLTLADLDICFVYVIPAIGIAIADSVWPYTRAWCVLQAFMIQPHFCINVLSIFAVNVERFIAISCPLKYPQIVTLKRSLIALGFVWLFTACIGTSIGFYSDWEASYHPLRQSCSFNSNFLSVMVIQEAVITGSFIIYARTACIVRKHHQTRMRLNGQRNCHRSNRKSATTVFLLSLSVLMCMIPLQLVLCLQLFKVHIPKAVALAANLSFASSGIWDAVLYYVRNKTIRKEMIRYLSLKFFRRSSSLSN